MQSSVLKAVPAPADCQSAIQQVANLRYGCGLGGVLSSAGLRSTRAPGVLRGAINPQLPVINGFAQKLLYSD